MNKDLNRIEELHNCNIYKTHKGEQEFIEIHTLKPYTMNNLTHINHVLKQYGLIITNDDYISLLFHNVIENNFNEQRKKDITLESAVKTLEYTLKENN